MLETKETEEVSKGLRKAWIIWGAMLGFLVFYTFIAHQIGEIRQVAFGFEIFRNIVCGLAVVQFGTAYFVRKHMAYFVRKRMSRAKPRAGQELKIIRKGYLNGVILYLGLVEAIGIYGFVLFGLGGGFKILYIFIFVSAIGLAVFRPKFEDLEQLAIAMRNP